MAECDFAIKKGLFTNIVYMDRSLGNNSSESKDGANQQVKRVKPEKTGPNPCQGN
jgi:hypothetical protein